MVLSRQMQPSFTAGELSPSLYARVDLTKYQTGLKAAKNVFIYPHGGVANRAGLEFCEEVKDSSSVTRMIPFQFNTTQNYVLEFGQEYMRVLKDGQQVLSTASAAISGAFGPTITSVAHGFSDGDEVYITGASGAVGLNGRNFRLENVTTDTFDLLDLFGNPVDITGYASGGTATAVYQISTPYNAADLFDIQFAQEADVMYLTHTGYAPRKLSRTGDASWALDVPTFAPAIAAPTNAEARDTLFTTLNITSVTAANPPVVTAVAHGLATGQKFMFTRLDALGTGADLLGVIYTVTLITADTFSLQATNRTGLPVVTFARGSRVTTAGGAVPKVTAYKISSISAATGEESLPSVPGYAANDLTLANASNIVTWLAVPGASRYLVYKLDNGVYGYIGGTEALTFTDQNVVADLSDTPQTGFNPFIGAGNYPRCVTFHEQRLVFASTNLNPQAVYMSQSANYENFGSSQPQKASDAITFRQRGSKVNEIRSMVSAKGLMLLTSAAEWIVTGGNDGVITPGSIVPKNQGYRGASSVAPLVVGNVILFPQRSGGVVRDFTYDWSSDAFTGADLTIMARHLFKKRSVKAWAYAQSPDSVVWCILDNGDLVSLTYMREHEVWAWTRHDTDGVFEDVVVEENDDRDVPYFIVRRTINGQTKRYIERMADRQVVTLDDCFFVDAGLKYDGAPTASISGFWHLEGKSVVALADGNVVKNLTVTNGAVTLPAAASVVAVGLPYLSEIETLALDVGAVQGLGTIQGRKKSVAAVTVRVEQSRGMFVGPDRGKMREWKQRTNEPYGTAIALYTGDFEQTLDADWNTNGNVVIQQNDPLPMAVLAIMPDVAIGG